MTKTNHEHFGYQVRATRNPSTVELHELRQLMDIAFGSTFTDSDWAHALGGIHYILSVDGRIAAHASVVPRTLWIGDSCYHAGYIEAVAVTPALQGRGLGTAIMQALEQDLEEFDIGALSTGEHRFYESLGWERWKGPSWVRRADGDVRSADEDGGIMIKRTFRTAPLTIDSKIICEARVGDDW